MKIALLILTFSVAAAAQKPTPSPTPTPCILTLAQSPAWQDIKLGMTEVEFQKIFPRMPSMVNKLDLPDTTAFAKVDNMMFTFYKERLEEVTIQFDLSVHWDNIGQFTDSLSDTLKLPRAWTFSVGTGMLVCREFNVRAVSSRNEIKLRDTVAAKKMQAENAPPPQKETPQKPRPYR